MFNLLVNNEVYTCPSEQSLIMLALVKAMDNGIVEGPIHDKQTAIQYLATIGVAVEEVDDE